MGMGWDGDGDRVGAPSQCQLWHLPFPAPWQCRGQQPSHPTAVCSHGVPGQRHTRRFGRAGRALRFSQGSCQGVTGTHGTAAGAVLTLQRRDLHGHGQRGVISVTGRGLPLPSGAITQGLLSPFPRESDLFLLDTQDLHAGTEGWLVFDVTAASNHWLVDRKYNLGLRLYVETDDGELSCSVWGRIPRNSKPR